MNLSQMSILGWIAERGIVSEKGEPLDFRDRPFLLDILCDWTPELVICACAQVGKSVSFTLKALYAVKYLRLNIIQTMPTQDDVNEFVSSKMNKLIQANGHEFKGMATDNIERKELDGRFIFMKGTVSKSAPISTTADVLIHDEVSRSDQGAIETYKSRIKASKYKGRWLFSNPTTERDELDLSWNKSDRKEWEVMCSSCNSWQQLVFPESIDFALKRFRCRHCDNTISDNDRRKGKWVKNAESDVSGYHISHLICPWISASDIIKDSESDPAYFNNFVLGLPYSPGDLSVSKSTLLDIWTPKNLNTGNVYIGIDVGNIKHYTIRSEKGILKIGRFAKWGELEDILDFWKPRAAVIDAMPDNTASRAFCEKYPYMKMSFFQENNANPQTIVWWGENDKNTIVYSHRDRILDQMLTNMIEAKWLIGVESNKDWHDYIKHYESLRRVKVTNNAGVERYVWESTNDTDHFVFSDLYAYIATLSYGSGAVFGDKKEKDYEMINEYNQTGDWSQYFKTKEQYG